jgi:hypothetical protein
MYEMPLRIRASVFIRPTALSGDVVQNVLFFFQEYLNIGEFAVSIGFVHATPCFSVVIG